MNFEISYCYRDGANHKKHASVIVEVPETASPQTIENALQRKFADVQIWPDILHFRPKDLGWPTAYFDGYDESEDDFNLHELDAITRTDKAANINYGFNDPLIL